MSLELVNSWITSAIGHPQAALEARQRVYEAACQHVAATLIVSSELTKSGHNYLAHWTGDELLVVQLSPRQKAGFNAGPATVTCELDYPSHEAQSPPLVLATLSDVRISDADSHNGRARLHGTCRYALDDPAQSGLRNCALRVRYFRPDLARQVVGYSYIDYPLIGPGGELRFSFDPLFSKGNPVEVTGPTFLFIQLIRTSGERIFTIRQRISNAVATMIELV